MNDQYEYYLDMKSHLSVCYFVSNMEKSPSPKE